MNRAARSAGTAAGRFGMLLGLGCLASGLATGSALAPVGSAVAAVDVRLDPAPPAALAMDDGPLLRPAFGRADAPDGVAPAEPAIDRDATRRFGARDIPARLVDGIVRAAERTGVDPIYLLALAETESGFRPTVRAATSSAQGLFQFIDRTWLEIVKAAGAEHGLTEEASFIALVDEKPVVADDAARARILALRNDPHVSALMAAELLKRDAALIGFRIGRRINETEMYLAHFLGLDEAVRFLTLRQARHRAAAALAFPAAARANAAIFYASRRRIRRGLSLDEVYARLDGLIAPRVERFRSVEVRTTLGS